MCKAVNLVILMLVVLLAAPIGAAFASQGQEQLIHEQFGTGSYATWHKADSGWDHGTPGSEQTTRVHEYAIPAEKLKNCKLTRIEVKTGYSFNPDAFEKAGGWQRIPLYADYMREILRYTPDALEVADVHDLTTGKVNVTWSLKLNPTRAEGGREARATTDPSIRQKLRELGFELEDDKTYDTAEQGWLWCLPVHIQWYGIPDYVPDFSVCFDDTHIVETPGTQAAIGVTYKLNSDHDKVETAKLELWQEREDGSLIRRITPDGEVREFEPGQDVRVTFKAEVFLDDTKCVAVIRPVSTDRDANWDNNRSELWLMGGDENRDVDLPAPPPDTGEEKSKIHIGIVG